MRRSWPTVEESVIAVKALVPLPWRRPVSVEAPVPPFATERSVESESVPAERTPTFPFVEKRLVDEAVVEKRLVVVAAVPVAFTHVRLVVDAVAAPRFEMYEFVEVALVVVEFVTVSPVMVASVEVKVSTMPVVKRARVEKREVEVAASSTAAEAYRLVVVAFVPVAFTKVRFWSVVEPVSKSVPAESTPIVPFVEKRLVDEAVVEKRFVEVAASNVDCDAYRFVEVAFPATSEEE